MTRILSSLLLIALFAGEAAAFDVTSCGQTVPAHEQGVVQNDLVCSSSPAVTLSRAAGLDLNGHSISGAGVQCVTGCDITSSSGIGLIAGTAGSGTGVTLSRGSIENVHVQDFDIGIFFERRLSAQNVVVSNNQTFGIRSFKGRLIAKALTVELNESGIEVGTGKVKAENLVASNNTIAGVFSKRMVGTNISANGNGQWGVTAAKGLRLQGGTANGNGVAGVASNGTLQLHDFEATGNGVADVAARRKPRVRTTTCDTSRKIGMPLEILSESWNVCPGE
jgi:hypothetical protein